MHVATPILADQHTKDLYLKTTKEPPQHGFGAWCFSRTCWFVVSYADFSQASTTLIHHRSSGVPVMGVPGCRTPGCWSDALKLDFNADRHPGPILRLHIPSGHPEIKYHKASPQSTKAFLPLWGSKPYKAAQGVTRKKILQLWWTLVGGSLDLLCS